MAYDYIDFNRLSPSQHFAIAKEACPLSELKNCTITEQNLMQKHLEAIPAGSPEFAVASPILANLRSVIDAEHRAEEEREAERNAFRCGTSTNNQPIMSFDGGATWKWDDGRCTAITQKKRDRDAEDSSYFPTTLHVDTDIDSSWLPNEQRECTSYPDVNGKVATVICNGNYSRHTHNIPIKFWGGVNRNIASEWKCTRDDMFVCKALN